MTLPRLRARTARAAGLLAAVGCAWLAAQAPPRAAAGEVAVRVAAAADLKYAMEDLVVRFHAEDPNTAVRVSYGSSGSFFAQLSNGAPFDLFFSADADYARRLAAQGDALPGSEFLYGVGRLVVWVPRTSAIEADLAALRDPAVKHVAIANPQHAPYGRAAEAALKSAGVYEAVKGKLVFGENVAQAAQFVQSGSAEAGLIALSLALAPPLRDEGRYREIPPEAHPRIEQGGVILARARDAAAARRFRDFVLGSAGRAVLERYGFLRPGS